MKSRFYKGTIEDSKWILRYLLSRYRDGKTISWFRERIEIIPFRAVWK